MKIKTASSMSLGRPAYAHDIRLTHTDNVNTDLSKDNVILIDKIQGRKPDEFIDELLQPSINEYNAKQKRKDRQIKSTYTEWHKLNDNKGEMIYEFVAQYGEHEDLGKLYYEASNIFEKNKLRNQFIETYTKWLNDWQDQHPNQIIAWATIHFDENGGDAKRHVGGTPHLHFAVIPLSHNFQRGPRTQISMSKSLESDGFERINARKDDYQLVRAFKKFREIQEKDLIQLGYEIKPYQGGKHQEPEIFKEIKEAEAELKELEKQTAEKMAKAEKAVEFISIIDKIEQEQEKILEREGIVEFKTIKKTPFSKPEEIAIQSKQDYESQEARKNISLLTDQAKRAEEEIKRKAKETLQSINKSTNIELEQKIDELQKEVFKEREKNIELAKKVKELSSIIENVKTFLRENRLVQVWTRHLEKIREKEQEREERTR